MHGGRNCSFAACQLRRAGDAYHMCLSMEEVQGLGHEMARRRSALQALQGTFATCDACVAALHCTHLKAPKTARGGSSSPRPVGDCRTGDRLRVSSCHATQQHLRHQRAARGWLQRAPAGALVNRAGRCLRRRLCSSASAHMKPPGAAAPAVHPTACPGCPLREAPPTAGSAARTDRYMPLPCLPHAGCSDEPWLAEAAGRAMLSR